MSEETQEVSELAETPAPEQAATAAPESENITPEEKSAELSKVFSQLPFTSLLNVFCQLSYAYCFFAICPLLMAM